MVWFLHAIAIWKPHIPSNAKLTAPLIDIPRQVAANFQRLSFTYHADRRIVGVWVRKSELCLIIVTVTDPVNK